MQELIDFISKYYWYLLLVSFVSDFEELFILLVLGGLFGLF